jgi:hypothetical protein
MLTQNLQAVLFGLTLLFLPSSGDLYVQEVALTTASGGDLPEGWYVFPNARLKNLDTQQCFNYSENQWQVTSEGGSVKIRKFTETEREIPPFPPLWRGGNGSAFLTATIHFPNAWLLASDAGEFGGGLWLTNEDGSVTKQILTDNVRALVPLDGSILVLSGLTHMAEDFGDVYIFSMPNKLDISLQFTIHLETAPRAYIRESDHSVLVATKNGLSRITKSGTKEEFFHFPVWARDQDEKSIVERSAGTGSVVYLGESHPNSIAIGHDGTLFVGMRLFVLRLRKSSTGYTEDWLLPSSCQRFQTRFETEKMSVDCVCTP